MRQSNESKEVPRIQDMTLSEVMRRGTYIAYLPDKPEEKYFNDYHYDGSFHGIIMALLVSEGQITHNALNVHLSLARVYCRARGEDYDGVILLDKNNHQYFLQLKGEPKIRAGHKLSKPYEYKIFQGWKQRIKNRETEWPPEWIKSRNSKFSLYVIDENGNPIYPLANSF